MDTLYSIISIACCVVVWILNSKFIEGKLVETMRQTPYIDFQECDPPLGSINGIGFRLFCGGRTDLNTNSQAWYLFFCFIIPLFPVSCYRATHVASSGRSESYKIFGPEEWRFWEIVSIYITSFAWIVGFISVICLIVSLFE